MKKLWLLTAAAVLAVSLSACGTGNLSADGTSTQAASSASSASSQASSAASVGEGSVSDDLAGLQKYLVSNASVSGTAETMRADIIGAKSGVRYKYGYNGRDNVTLELYEYDAANRNDIAKKVLESVKSTGSFTLLGSKVNATLSQNGRYLLILNDTASDSENLAYADRVKKLVTAFKAS